MSVEEPQEVPKPPSEEERAELGLGEEFQGEELRQFAIVQEGNEIDEEYSVGIFEFGVGVGECCEIIIICELDGKLLVAIPDKAWHRVVAKRFVPPRCLTKASLVGTAAASPSERIGGAALGLSMKVWIGFLDPRFEEMVSFVNEADPVMGFAGTTGPLLPLAAALADVANDHFSFKTAESGHPGNGGDGAEERLQKLEETMSAIQKTLLELAGGSTAAPRGSALKATPKTKGVPKETHVKGLDPAVVQSALTAGIPAAHLQEMSKILGEKPRRLEEVPRGARVQTSGPLDEVAGGQEEETSEEEVEDGGDASAGSGVEKALIQLTKIASHLTENRRKDPLEQLLDSGGSGSAGSSDLTGPPSSKKNAAALRALQKALRDQPTYLFKVLEANLQSDFLSRPVAPGEPMVSGTTARGWLTAKSRVMNYTNHVRWVWQVAGIWDALMGDRIPEARARAGLLVAAADQASIDGGSWLLSSASLLEASPPYQMFSQHQPPSTYENQHSALYDPRWMEVFMNFVREMDSYQEVRKKLGKGPKNPTDKDEEPVWRPRPKPKPKPTPKKKGQSEETG